MQQGELIAGRYRLEQVVGSGGMGEVWRATDTELDRVVAVKRATVDSTDVLREARIAAGLHHPNIVTLYDSVIEDGHRWLILEYVPSHSLADTLRQTGRLSVAAVAHVGVQVADAIAAVHAAGVVHRDVKPGNILIDQHGRAKLTDFGISRQVWNDRTATESGLVAGTPAYLAPEVAQGHEPTEASDVFSLGATLYAAVEGEPPFGRADNPLVILRRAADGTVPAPRSAGPLAPVLAALVRRKPADRPTAATARQLLANVVTELSGGVPVSGRRLWTRQRLAAAGAAAAVVLVGAAVVVPNLGGSTVSGTAAAGAPLNTAKPATLGELHSADPCALFDPARFSGDPVVDPEYANFNRCDLLIGDVDLSVTMEDSYGDEEDDAAPSQTVGKIRIQRPPTDKDECHRTLVLADDNRLVVSADADPGKADFCAIADTQAEVTARILNAGPVPPRRAPLPRESLGWLDACGLLEATALAKVPGTDPNDPQHGVGNWMCLWDIDPGDGYVQVKYDRNPPLSGDDGTPITLAGRDAFVMAEDEGPGSCVVAVAYRSFRGATGETKVEYVRVALFDDRPVATLCTTATSLATDVASRLPRP